MSQVRNILIVDDDEELRSSLAEQIALHEEFLVWEAATAAQGVALARERAPDLVILDVGLPDMDGREALKVLRREKYPNPIPS